MREIHISTFTVKHWLGYPKEPIPICSVFPIYPKTNKWRSYITHTNAWLSLQLCLSFSHTKILRTKQPNLHHTSDIRPNSRTLIIHQTSDCVGAVEWWKCLRSWLRARRLRARTLSLRPKWHPIPYIVHYFWPNPCGQVVHYVGNRLQFGTWVLKPGPGVLELWEAGIRLLSWPFTTLFSNWSSAIILGQTGSK